MRFSYTSEKARFSKDCIDKFDQFSYIREEKWKILTRVAHHVASFAMHLNPLRYTKTRIN